MNVDFAPKNLANVLYKVPAWLLLGVALCLLVLLLSVYQTWQTAEIWYRQRQELELMKNKLDGQLKASKNKPVEPISNEKIRLLNQQIELLNIAWPTLFDALEENRGDEVTLLDLTLNGVEKSLVLSIEVQKIEEAINFIERIKRAEKFQAITINRHEVAQRNGLSVIRVFLQARWQ